MSDVILHILSPVIGLVANVSVQVALCRCEAKFGLLKTIVIGFWAGILIVSFLETHFLFKENVAPIDMLGQFILNLVTYSAMGYCYFHFINLGETARRIRILRELYDSEMGLTLEEILLRYNAEQIVKARIKRMVGNEQIVLKNGKYYIKKPTLLYMARIMILLKLIFLGAKSEFDRSNGHSTLYR